MYKTASFLLTFPIYRWMMISWWVGFFSTFFLFVGVCLLLLLLLVLNDFFFFRSIYMYAVVLCCWIFVEMKVRKQFYKYFDVFFFFLYVSLNDLLTTSRLAIRSLCMVYYSSFSNKQFLFDWYAIKTLNRLSLTVDKNR